MSRRFLHPAILRQRRAQQDCDPDAEQRWAENGVVLTGLDEEFDLRRPRSNGGMSMQIVVDLLPALIGRLAQCSCGRTEPSSPELAFFEFRGPGSSAAEITCKRCGYFDCAHDAEAMARNRIKGRTVIERGLCTGFEAHGAFEFDKYYCGCFGWE